MTSLCDSCRHMHRFTRVRGQEVRICNVQRSMHVPSDIVSCSMYHDKSQPDKYDLQEIAWKLGLDKSGKVTGFEPPKNNED